MIVVKDENETPIGVKLTVKEFLDNLISRRIAYATFKNGNEEVSVSFKHDKFEAIEQENSILVTPDKGIDKDTWYALTIRQ